MNVGLTIQMILEHNAALIECANEAFGAGELDLAAHYQAVLDSNLLLLLDIAGSLELPSATHE